MARRLGRWQQLLADALGEHETVAVQTVVEEHLGRPANHAELNAAQRAAHLLARRGSATIGYVAAPAGTRRSRLAVSRPPEGLDGLLNQEDGPSARPDLVRWLPPATPAPEPPARFGRWQQVIMDALDQYEVVGLRAAVEGHLGRRGVRAESIAAQRAAHLLARCGQVNLARVRVPPARGRRGAELLVIARTEVNPATLTAEALQKAATRYVATADRTRESLADIVAAIDQAAAQVSAVDLHAVDADTAGQTAQALAVPLRQLTLLRQSLLSRRPPL